MRAMLQIEYNREPKNEAEKEEGYSKDCLVSVETLSCADLDNPEHVQVLHDLLDEYIKYAKLIPEGAKFWVGEKCDCH